MSRDYARLEPEAATRIRQQWAAGVVCPRLARKPRDLDPPAATRHPSGSSRPAQRDDLLEASVVARARRQPAGVGGAVGRPGRLVRSEVMPAADYGPTGFVPSVSHFSGPGCWRITGSLRGHTLFFVTRVRRAQ
jgi:hypothetical protein